MKAVPDYYSGYQNLNVEALFMLSFAEVLQCWVMR